MGKKIAPEKLRFLKSVAQDMHEKILIGDLIMYSRIDVLCNEYRKKFKSKFVDKTIIGETRKIVFNQISSLPEIKKEFYKYEEDKFCFSEKDGIRELILDWLEYSKGIWEDLADVGGITMNHLYASLYALTGKYLSDSTLSYLLIRDYPKKYNCEYIKLKKAKFKEISIPEEVLDNISDFLEGYTIKINQKIVEAETQQENIEKSVADILNEYLSDNNYVEEKEKLPENKGLKKLISKVLIVLFRKRIKRGYITKIENVLKTYYNKAENNCAEEILDIFK